MTLRPYKPKVRQSWPLDIALKSELHFLFAQARALKFSSYVLFDHECGHFQGTFSSELLVFLRTSGDLCFGASYWLKGCRVKLISVVYKLFHTDLRRAYSTAYLLRLRVRIPPGLWLSVSCRSIMLAGRDVCDGPVTRPWEFYRVWSV
jgi:hypothetical protein